MSSPSDLKFSPHVIRLGVPVVHSGKKPQRRYRVLDETSFVELVITRALTKAQIHQQFSVPLNVVDTSLSVYKSKYKDDLQRIKHQHYATAMKGNRRGERVRPGVLLDKQKLSSLLAEGRSLPELARRLQTSEWFVRQNIRYHGLAKTGELPYRMQDVDAEYLRLLETFSPGITAEAKSFYKEPHQFYLLLYAAFTRLMELVWFIKDQARGHAYYRRIGKIPKDHIAWGTNPHELRLSRALLAAGIPHLREVCFYKNCRADFGFPGASLLVETDGEYHDTNAQTKRQDQTKQRHARRLGYRILHIRNKALEKDLDSFVQRIKSLLPAKSSVSPQQEDVVCGTSPSKTTSPTSPTAS
jgi:very-short-patch-repair endonuclease